MKKFSVIAGAGNMNSFEFSQKFIGSAKFRSLIGYCIEVNLGNQHG
ncbi:hypothetical protein TSIB_1745 [Thermococcus sibiricus MM 739]|uniref:Uncharacterized protein n=1 Tax=Thermococcus sibiricus (strain DSM 12597 / MM 739) TaxID=604354 RepID=C6A5A1_THESM|nr:hypothetical protein TSIB_1745 [Thermococcus sibiricus MM 739]